MIVFFVILSEIGNVKVRVSEILIKERIRKDLGNIQELSESIRKFGLLQPILIDLNNYLIAGYRRLMAVKSLGWEYIEVKVIDVKDSGERVILEMEENKHRQDFSGEDWERSTEFLERYTGKGFAHFWKYFWNDLWKRK
jgi:ParB family transcriptional regulator, chromosome partitioning protein